MRVRSRPRGGLPKPCRHCWGDEGRWRRRGRRIAGGGGRRDGEGGGLRFRSRLRMTCRLWASCSAAPWWPAAPRFPMVSSRAAAALTCGQRLGCWSVQRMSNPRPRRRPALPVAKCSGLAEPATDEGVVSSAERPVGRKRANRDDPVGAPGRPGPEGCGDPDQTPDTSGHRKNLAEGPRPESKPDSRPDTRGAQSPP